MLSKIKLMGFKVDETNQATEDLELFMRSAGLDQFGLALLDSGASHPLREAVDEQEFQRAANVKVELADGRAVDLRQTSSGTLLSDQPSGTQPPIVPLGSLVQQLGCTVTWSRRRGLQVHHPVHGEIVVKMNGNCPMISEVEALKLISRLRRRTCGGCAKRLRGACGVRRRQRDVPGISTWTTTPERERGQGPWRR